MLNINKRIRYAGSHDAIIKDFKVNNREELQYKYIYIKYKVYAQKSIKDMRNEYRSIIGFLKRYNVKDNNIEFVIKKYYDYDE